MYTYEHGKAYFGLNYTLKGEILLIYYQILSYKEWMPFFSSDEGLKAKITYIGRVYKGVDLDHLNYCWMMKREEEFRAWYSKKFKYGRQYLVWHNVEGCPLVWSSPSYIYDRERIKYMVSHREESSI